MRKEILIYTAGLFDGEGSIIIQRAKPNSKLGQKSPVYWLSVSIGMTDKETIMWLKKTFGGNITPEILVNWRPSRKPYFHWRITSRQALGFLESILPYLRSKQKQSRVAIQFQSQKDKHTSHILTLRQLRWRERYKCKVSELSTHQRYYKSTIPYT